ncbi:MAG: hypothetical protein ACKVVP_09950 [Chloroflexota bacterium]
MRRHAFGARTSFLYALLLAIGLIGPAWADDDDKKRQSQDSQEVDCEDRDNAALQECQTMNPPVQMVEQESSEPSAEPAPAPRQTGPQLFTGSPMEIVLKLPDAGKEAVQYRSEEGADAKSRWARNRFERRDDSGSSDSLGPRVIDHTIHVTATVEQAKQLFKDEAAKNDRFPEQAARDARKGTFKWDLKNLVEQTAAISACNDCSGSEQLMLHHRVVQQRANVVSVIYVYGRDQRKGGDEILTQKAAELWPYLVSERI